jgi:type 1 glutamine amidotransferase/predicted GH43/DUF377 family glycosyl hydrolase
MRYLCVLLALLTPRHPAAEPLKVHMIGVGEYSPEQSLTTLRIHLEEHFRIKVTMSLGGDSKSFPNLEPLKSADVLVLFARRTNPPEEQMALLRTFWESGKGIVAMRTASHAFQKDVNEVFDKQVLGGSYRGAGDYVTPFEAIVAPGKSAHPILRGVGPITSRGYYNNDKLASDADVLQIVRSDKKNKAPVSWTHAYKGTKTFYTSMGTPEDFRQDDFLRMLANAVYWTAGRDPASDARAPAETIDLKFPPELVQFRAYPKNPVFAGEKGKWDAKIRERGWVLKDGKEWKLWYTGYDGTKEGQRLLGYATSPDGIAWTRWAKNPLVREHWVEDMCVVPHKGKYYMFAEGKGDQAHLLVSADGAAEWTRLGSLDVRKRNGEPIPPGPYGTPTAWFDNGAWHLLYERSDLGIWLAKSKDMKTWPNVQDEPVMVPGPADYDKDLIAPNQIIKVRDRYYLYYHGSTRTGPNAKKWSTCLATSTDLIRWDRYPRNPLLPHTEDKSSGIVVHDGERYRLYTMHPEVHVHFAK